MSSFLDQVPPQDLNAEQGVLGAWLIDRDAITRCLGRVRPDDFYADKNKEIARAILALYEQGTPVDLITVTNYLQTQAQLDQVGGVSYVGHLASSVPTTENAEVYASIVEQTAAVRRLQHTGRKLADAGYRPDAKPEELLAQAEAEFDAVRKRRPTGRSMQRLGTLLVSSFDTLEQRNQAAQAGKTVTGVTSGFKLVDQMTAGFQPSDLIILAARPSVGKTAFSLNLARNAAVLGKKRVTFFSLEMSAEQLAMRMLAAEAAVHQERIRTGALKGEDWRRLANAMARLDEHEFWIDDTPGLSAPELMARARRQHAEVGIDLLIIDYLQLMSGSGKPSKEQNRQQEISEISRSLKGLARELKIPVIALSQLSRGVEQRQDKRPMMSDLRESGAIEQDADVVAFLYRDDYYDKQSDRKNIVEVIFAKQRSGPTGTADVYFMKDIGKFMDVAPAEHTA